MRYFLLALLFAGCAQQKASPQAQTSSHKELQSIWTTSSPASFYRIILASDRFDVESTAEVITSTNVDGCDSTVYLHGDDNSGSTIVTTGQLNCSQYNGQAVTYQRIDDLTMQFCLGGICANYQ